MGNDPKKGSFVVHGDCELTALATDKSLLAKGHSVSLDTDDSGMKTFLLSYNGRRAQLTFINPTNQFNHKELFVKPPEKATV
jgi:hypothetical protein